MRRLAGFVIACCGGRLGVALGDERVRLIGDLGEGEQVLEAEAVRRLPLVAVTADPQKGDIVMGDPADVVFPDGRLDGSDPEFRCGF